MKPQELMINDFVLVDTLSEQGWIPTKVREVAEECILVNLGEGKEEVDDSAFKPIPLTPSLLTAHGFREEVDVENAICKYYLKTPKNDLEIHCDPYGDCHFMRKGYSLCYINYVHQFQQILRLVNETALANSLKL